MSSKKIKIWDFEKNGPYNEKKPIIVFSSDHFISKYVKESISRNHKPLVGLWAESISKGWIQEKFYDLNLFQETNVYYIYNSENLPQDTWELLENLVSEGQEIVLHFSKKNKVYKKLAKEYEVMEVTAHAFWEVDRLIEYFSKEIGVKVTPVMNEFFSVWSQANTFEVYDSLLRLKVLNLDISKMKIEDFQRELSHLNSNSFVFGGLLANKEFNNLMKEILRLFNSGAEGEIFSVLNFLKNMLLKSSQLEEGERVQNNYQRQLHKIKNAFSPKLLSFWIKTFSELEILLKRKDLLFKRKLEEISIRY